jgi:hypothetical protein
MGLEVRYAICTMEIRRELPAELPWFAGVVGTALLSALERVAFLVEPSERALSQRVLDGVLFYGAVALAIALPILSARYSREMSSRRSAWIRVLLGCVWGPVLMLVLMSIIANNVDGGLALFTLPFIALIAGAVSMSVVVPGARPSDSASA